MRTLARLSGRSNRRKRAERASEAGARYNIVISAVIGGSPASRQATASKADFSANQTRTRKGSAAMKAMMITLAIGAGLVSAGAAAQQAGAGGSYMQRDQTRAEAQQRAD